MEEVIDEKKAGGVKEIFSIALPMVISTACDGIMTFTDRLFLAKTGSQEMNAAFGGGVMLMVLTFFFAGIIGYSNALVAQYFGSEQRHKTTIVCTQSFLLAVFAYPLILLALPLANFFFEFMNIPTQQQVFQQDYLRILAIGSIFSLLRQVFSSYFSGLGKTRIVMVSTIIAMLVNILLDYILIFGKFGFPVMGVAGAAIATVAGWFFAVLVLLFVYLRKENYINFCVKKSLHLDKVVMKKLLRYGYPPGLEAFLDFLAFSVMISMFQAKGDVISTATSVLFNWDLISFIPLVGIEIAVTSLAGRYIGAKRTDIAQKVTFSGIKLGFFYTLFTLLVFLCIPEILVNIFRPENNDKIFNAAIPTAVNMIRMAAIYVLIESVFVSIIGTLRAAGDTFYTMMVTITAHWFFIPILYLFLNVLQTSAEVAWLAVIIFFLTFCFVLIQRYQSGKWKQLHLIEN